MLGFILIMGVLAGAVAIFATRKVAREMTSRVRMQRKVCELTNQSII
jgi:hypothetical protein